LRDIVKGDKNIEKRKSEWGRARRFSSNVKKVTKSKPGPSAQFPWDGLATRGEEYGDCGWKVVVTGGSVSSGPASSRRKGKNWVGKRREQNSNTGMLKKALKDSKVVKFKLA